MSLATVEREIEAVHSRWHATAITGVTDAALRHLARYRDLFARALAIADSADSPKVALAALVQAAKLNEAEARLLEVSDRHLSRGWIEGEYRQREQERIRQEQEQKVREQKRAAAEARTERERERVAHNESIGWLRRLGSSYGMSTKSRLRYHGVIPGILNPREG